MINKYTKLHKGEIGETSLIIYENIWIPQIKLFDVGI